MANRPPLAHDAFLNKQKNPRNSGVQLHGWVSGFLDHPVAIEPRPLSRLSDEEDSKLDDNLIMFYYWSDIRRQNFSMRS